MHPSAGYLYQFHFKVVSRDDFIVSYCKNKNVIHVGCTDYPFTKERMLTNQLLHCKLEKVTTSLLGIDTDEAGIALLKTKCENSTFLVQDMTQDFSLYQAEEWDVLLLLDVIEHITNIHAVFLNAMTLFKTRGNIVVTTPNALSLRAASRAIFSRERIHTDHFSYYSPATLYHLGNRYGLRFMHFFGFNYPYTNRLMKLILAPFQKLAPLCSDGIGAVFKI